MDAPGPAPARRLVILGAGGARKTEDAIARAARDLGHAVRLVDVVGWRRRLGPLGARAAEWRAASFEPDTVLVTRHAWRLGEARLRRLFAGRRSVFWFFDPAPHPGTLELARLVDEFYLTYRGQRERYRAEGVRRVRFLPQGMDPGRDRPAPPRTEYRCDVSFVGSGPYPYRWEVLRAVGAVARLQIRGPGWQDAPADLPVAGGPVHGREFARVVASAAIALGANALPEQAHDEASASNRMWKILGCGGCYLGPLVPGIETFARDRAHCRWYRSTEECVAIVRELLADPDQRARLAEAGRAHALAHHTYAARMALLLAGREYPSPEGG
ncbi:MAG TPA: glycosyltransferase [Gemmatimonadales bacterium]|nr:glycosyltransferase [Gemmatimonadales bacterium]